jgi:hypothetical protein
VPYALFENDDRLTRPFRTEREVWEAAERADLTTTNSQGGKVLDNNFEIKPCEASPDEVLATNGQDSAEQDVNSQDIIFPERTIEGARRGGTNSDQGRSAGNEDAPMTPAKSPL